MLQHAPRVRRLEPLHEFSRAGRVQRGAELVQLEYVVLRQHLAQLWQEERVDHECASAKEEGPAACSALRCSDCAETMSIERIRKSVKGDGKAAAACGFRRLLKS